MNNIAQKYRARVISAIFIAAIAGPSFAEVQCKFTIECFENELCQETSFEIDYLVTTYPRAPGPRGIIAQTEFGEIRGQESANTSYCMGAQTNTESFHLVDDTTTYLLTVSPEGARFTAHMDGPISISYLGHCEEVI
ncbi:hypothetical protein [Yoonia sp. I 8.24]|uniref:hypothetical protein n=1 Tax=Yoonia sp. I 8.24 TaxID=1537229 RepID=UPI001EDFA356|nr:hypothetical protein [Yoonia sp. I 8.24]MCG3266202.1 hypothetical protein [Yoonia sp. I 8.24]